MDKERERLIGARLRAFREWLQIPRSRFAVKIGFGSERIASYESGLAPLPYAVFRQVAKHYEISPLWLAEHKGIPKIKNAAEDSDFIQDISGRALFSDVYDRFFEAKIKEGMAQRASEMVEMTREIEKINEALADKSIPEKERKAMIRIMAPAVRKFIKMTGRFDADSNAVNSKLDDILENEDLTDITKYGNNGAVKAKLPALIKRLNESTCERGTKTALAKFMGVPLSKVSQWLSGTHEPGGETTLQLLHWVEQQERQK